MPPETDPLDSIVAEAAALDLENAAPPLPGAPEPAPVVDPAQEWRDAVNQGGDLLLATYPQLKPEWTPARLDALGNALAKCADHYGWTIGALLGHPLVGLAFAGWPLGVSLVRLGKEEAARKGKAAPQAGTAPAAAGAPESVFSRAGNLEMSPQ